MSRPVLCAIALVGGACCFIRASAGQADPDPATLIKALEEGDFDERQQAAKKLQQLREAARSELEKAENAEDLEVRHTAKRLLKLLNLASIRFEVLDSQGKPLAGAEGEATAYDHVRVHSLGEQQPKPISLKSDADGFALSEGHQPALINLSIRWTTAALSPFNQHLGQLVLGPGLNRLPYVLATFGKVKAETRSSETQKPLDNVKVTLVPAGQGYEFADLDQLIRYGWLQHTASGTSDAQGLAVLERVAPGNYVAVAHHDDCVAVASPAFRVREGAEISLDAPLLLKPKASACGTLKVQVLSEGKPVKKGKLAVNTVRKPTKEEQQAHGFQQMHAWRFHMMHRHQEPQHETDDDGWVELKDLKPGMYRVAVTRENQREIVLDKVLIEAGKTAQITAEQKVQGASITGKVVSSEGQGVKNANVMALRIDDLEDAAETGYEPFSQLRQQHQWSGRRHGKGNVKLVTDAEGTYTIKDLSPGDYAVHIVLPRGRSGVIFGVKVEVGKSVTAADLVLPATGPADATGQTWPIAGKVITPDGKNIEQGQINLHYRDIVGGSNGSWGNGINREGTFTFDTRHLGDDATIMEPLRLLVTAQGYRPQSVDLTQPGLDMKDLQIRLEKQTYAKVKIFVSDDKGAKLRGAVVSAAARYRNHRAGTSSKRANTNAEGEAVLSGMAFGKRAFQAELAGYYLENPVEAEIGDGKTNEVRVTLRPTLKLTGLAELPTGVDPARVVFSIQANSDQYIGRTFGLDAQGKFAIEGLRQGSYSLHSCYPGLVLASEQEIELKDKPEMQLTLKLVRSGGLVVDMRAGTGAQLSLIPQGSWKPLDIEKMLPKRAGHAAFDLASGTGKSEFFNIPPGSYDVLVTRHFGQRHVGRKANHATLRLSDFQVVEFADGYAALEKAPPVVRKMPTEMGHLTGRVSLKEPLRVDTNSGGVGTLTLYCVNANAMASVAFTLPQDLDARRRPLAVGTAPAGLDIGSADVFEFKDLPVGEYKLYAVPTAYNQGYVHTMSGYSTRSKPEQDEEAATKPLRTLTVEAGKTVDVGEVVCEIGAKLRESLAKSTEQQLEMSYGGMEVEDEPEIVRP